MLDTTLDLLHKANACKDRYRHLLERLGRDWPKDKAIPLSAIVEHNGLNDALWALWAVLPEQATERDRIARLFACDCAEAVLPIYERKYPNDKRPRNAIETARRYAVGEATAGELAAARDAAWAAAWDAAWDAAGDAAWDAAWAAARAAQREMFLKRLGARRAARTQEGQDDA